MEPSLSLAELRQWFERRQAFALLDIREPGEFNRGHLYAASNVAASRLEWTLEARVPARGVPVVLCADREGPLAAESLLRLRLAAATIRALGYRDVRLLEGGPLSWEKAGFEVFTGFNVPSKTFGERLEEVRHTPAMPARELNERLGEPGLLVVDCRPREEHLRGAVPGAIHLPGVELGARLDQWLARQRGRPKVEAVVVHCAGRTRGIVAAQSLRDLGYEHRIHVLDNGLIGWELAGLATRPPADATIEGRPELSEARLQHARRWAERAGVRRLSLAAWRERVAEYRRDDTRALYAFDVRSPDEFASSPVEGFRTVPGGQLLQSLDDHLAVWRSSVVLFDTVELRALIVGAYLREMGLDDVCVIEAESAPMLLAQRGGARAAAPQAVATASPAGSSSVAASAPATVLAPLELARRLDLADWPRIDLGPSPDYRQRHLPGARFVARGLVHRFQAEWQRAPGVVLLCADGRLSAVEAVRLQAAIGRPVVTLAGGNLAWQQAGLPLSAQVDWLTEPIDVATTPYDYEGDIHRQLQAYVDWELALVGKAARDGSLPFRI